MSSINHAPTDTNWSPVGLTYRRKNITTIPTTTLGVPRDQDDYSSSALETSMMVIASMVVLVVMCCVCLRPQRPRGQYENAVLRERARRRRLEAAAANVDPEVRKQLIEDSLITKVSKVICRNSDVDVSMGVLLNSSKTVCCGT